MDYVTSIYFYWIITFTHGKFSKPENKIELYEDENFGGDFVSLKHSVPKLGQLPVPFYNKASSVKIYGFAFWTLYKGNSYSESVLHVSCKYI